MTNAAQHAPITHSRPGAERDKVRIGRAANALTPAHTQGAPEAILSLQRGAGNHATSALIQQLRPSHASGWGGGRPLAPDLRADMEARFGQDFSAVRVHDDQRAHESAQAVSAHAYTVGSDIVFQRGGYDPSSRAGCLALAHELTHVVQQRTGPVDGMPVADGMRISDPSDRFEREATANAERVISAAAPVAAGEAGPSGPATTASGSPGPPWSVQRCGEDSDCGCEHAELTGQQGRSPGAAVQQLIQSKASPGHVRGTSTDPGPSIGVLRVVQRQDIFSDFRKEPPGGPFAFPGVQLPDRLRFTDRIFMNESLPTVCPRCHRETPTIPMPPRYLDKDATEPRLVMWATESEAELHNDSTARMIQLDPAAIDTIVDDYGVGLIKRITSTHEFEGSQKVRDEGAETIRRRWPDIRPPVRDSLVAWYQGERATSIGMTPKWASPVLRPEHLKAVLASHEGKTAPLGRHGAVAVPGQRIGVFEINDINDYTVYFHRPGRPVWLYEISQTDFIKHDPFITKVAEQVAENTQWIRFIMPFLLKAGAFTLGFSGSVAFIIAGIVLDELGEEGLRDAEGKPARSPQEILTSAGTQFLIDRIFHGLLGGSGKKAAHALDVAPQLVGKIEKMADRAVPLVRKELVAAEKPLVKEALEHGTARKVTDDVLKAEGNVLEVAIESGGQQHIFRMNKNGKWCRLGSTICDLELGADVAALAKSPKSSTVGRLEEARERIKDIEHQRSSLKTIWGRMSQRGKVDVSLLNKEERAFLNELAEEEDAAKLTLPELRDMADSPEFARHIKETEELEKGLVEQLYREGRPLYEIMRAASPSSKARILRAA